MRPIDPPKIIPLLNYLESLNMLVIFIYINFKKGNLKIKFYRMSAFYR